MTMGAEPSHLASDTELLEAIVSRAFTLVEELDSRLHEAKAEFRQQLEAVMLSRDPATMDRIRRTIERVESGSAEFVAASELADLDRKTRG